MLGSNIGDRSKQERKISKGKQKLYNNSMGVSPTNKKVNCKKALHASRAIKRLTKKRPFITAISGPAHWKIIEIFRGSRDCKNEKIVPVYNAEKTAIVYYTSPAIESKVAGYNTAVRRQYQKIGRNLDEISLFLNTRVKDLQRNAEKYINLDNTDLNPVFPGEENKNRHCFEISEDKKFLQNEKSAILEEISIIRAEILSVDEQMKCFQKVAKASVLENIAHYYEGVLKMNCKTKQYNGLPVITGHPISELETDVRLQYLIQMTEEYLKRFEK